MVKDENGKVYRVAKWSGRPRVSYVVSWRETGNGPWSAFVISTSKASVRKDLRAWERAGEVTRKTATTLRKELAAL